MRMMELKWVWFLTIAVLSVLLVWEGTPTHACLEYERIALLHLKPFFNHHNKLVDWDDMKGSDCCEWRGIECNTTTRRLVGLSLNYTRYSDKGWYLNASLFLPFVELKSLYLRGNSIAGCIQNEGFEKLSSKLSNLEILDLSENHLNDSIMLSLSELSSLRYLSLAYNGLKGSSHPNDKTQLRLTKLEHLDLSYNLFRNNTISFLKGLSSLKSLYMYSNDLQGSFDIKDLSHLTNLKELDLSSNRIESLESSKDDGTKLQQWTHLEELHLDENLLNNSVFASLNGFSSLKYLSIRGNQLKGSLDTKDLEAFSSLRELYVSGNQLKDFVIHKGWCDLKNLQVLDLSGNLFRNNTFSFPKGLSSLKSLNMNSNDLQGSLDIKGLENLTNLKELDLSDNGIESLGSYKDKTQLRLTKLEHLDLSRNRFRNNTISFPKALSSLKSLIMYSNNLQGSLDIKDLSHLTNLKELDLSSNRIESLRSSKGLLSNLNYLDISYNQLKGSLDTKDLDAFSRVRELYASGNQLKGFVIHNGCCYLKNLHVLDLSRNAFEGMLPHYLGNLTSLRELDVSDNQFYGNLTPLANLTSLRSISLARNHFQIPTSFVPLANLPNLKLLYANENKMVMEPSFQFHTSLPKFQLRFISVSKCITSPELGFELFTFLYYQYDLRYVDFSENNFSGTFPNWLLENNTELEYLLLKGNSFSGPLSLPLAPKPNVSLVDISDNKLQGQIPSNICSTFPHLSGLSLYKNDIEGNIPPCLSGMKDLFLLDLSNNHLSGRLPEELIRNNSLRILRLSNNNLSGNVVPTILKANGLMELYLDGNNFSAEMENVDVSAFEFPTSLSEIDLSNNNLYGKLPRWIGNLSDLTILALSNNHFESSIPREFCNLNGLEYLDLSQNNLSGSIPSCFNPPYIEHVHLQGNRLNGPLSFAFYNSSSLVTLDLGGNDLNGSIPEWIDTLSSLSVLLLEANHLQGGIPFQLCKLYSLSIIDLSQNMFTGHIPSCLGNLTLPMKENKVLNQVFWGFLSEEEWLSKLERGAVGDYPVRYMQEGIKFTTKRGLLSYGGQILENMTGIDLSSNKLTGQIPHELGNLSQIHSLNLSHNNLIGVIPSSFSKLKQLESLDLSYNNLTGKIPNQLIDLNSLEVFSVAHNNLSGSIPEPKAQFGTFDESSYEGNYFLCGPMLHKSCSKTGSPPTTSSASNEEEEEDSLLYIYVFRVSFLVSYAVMLVTTFVVLYINPYWRRAWFSFVEKCITTCRCSTIGNFLAYYIFRSCV